MTITLNGRRTDVHAGATVAEVIAQTISAPGGRGTAVARNGQVVPRSAWDSTTLHDGDAVEVLTASQGG